MDKVRELAALSSLEDLAAKQMGHYGDALLILGEQLARRPPRKYVEALVGILPPKPLRHSPEWIRLYVVTSTGTEYGAIRGVEEALARYYQKTGRLAVVEPLRRHRGLSLRDEFPFAGRVVAKRGAVIYADE